MGLSCQAGCGWRPTSPLTPQPPLPRGEGEPEPVMRAYAEATLFAQSLPASGRVAEGREGSVRQPQPHPRPLSYEERGARAFLLIAAITRPAARWSCSAQW